MRGEQPAPRQAARCRAPIQARQGVVDLPPQQASPAFFQQGEQAPLGVVEMRGRLVALDGVQRICLLPQARRQHQADEDCQWGEIAFGKEIRQGDLGGGQHSLPVDQSKHRASFRHGGLSHLPKDYTLGAYPPEGHFNQVPRAHLPIQFRRQVIMKDARYLGHVDGNFKVGRHTAGGVLRLKESWAMRSPSMFSARRRSSPVSTTSPTRGMRPNLPKKYPAIVS